MPQRRDALRRRVRRHDDRHRKLRAVWARLPHRRGLFRQRLHEPGQSQPTAAGSCFGQRPRWADLLHWRGVRCDRAAGDRRRRGVRPAHQSLETCRVARHTTRDAGGCCARRSDHRFRVPIDRAYRTSRVARARARSAARRASRACPVATSASSGLSSWSAVQGLRSVNASWSKARVRRVARWVAALRCAGLAFAAAPRRIQGRGCACLPFRIARCASTSARR